MKLATVMAIVGAFCFFTGAGIVLGDGACDGGAGYCENQASTNPCPSKSCYSAAAVACPDGSGNTADRFEDVQYSVFWECIQTNPPNPNLNCTAKKVGCGDHKHYRFILCLGSCGYTQNTACGSVKIPPNDSCP